MKRLAVLALGALNLPMFGVFCPFLVHENPQTIAVSEAVAGGGMQPRPGSTAPVGRILLDGSNPEFAEVVVNQGNSIQLRPMVLDADGKPRNCVSLRFTSLDTTVATVDESGLAQGLKKGFSTLTIRAGDLTVLGTISVVEVRRGFEAGAVTGVVQDLAGRLYLSGTEDHVIRRSDSIESTPEHFAGIEGVAGFRNGDRLQALFNHPAFLALNQASGELYVSDSGNHQIRKINRDGLVETLAGTTRPGFADGDAYRARFRNPQGLALDGRGRLWVADSGNNALRRIDLVSGRVETVAGLPERAGLRDGPGAQALFHSPMGIALETAAFANPQNRGILVADTGNGRIRRVFENGRVETLTTARISSGTSLPGVEVALTFDSPIGLATDPAGNAYITEPEAGLAKVIRSDGAVAPLSEARSEFRPRGVAVLNGGQVGLFGSAALSVSVEFAKPEIGSVSPDTSELAGGEEITITGRNFTADSLVVIGDRVVYDVNVADTDTIQFVAPSFGRHGEQNLTVVTRGGLASGAFLVKPIPFEHLAPGEITTVLGGASFLRDGIPATQARLQSVEGVAVDSLGNVYLSDFDNNRVRKVDKLGIITTVAGSGCDPSLQYCPLGDGGPAISASLHGPKGIELDSHGDLYIADSGHNRVRKVDVATGVISTVAGNNCDRFLQSCPLGDGGPAISAWLNAPADATFDKPGNLYIVDQHNGRIRKVDRATGNIQTVAGSCLPKNCELGDGGPATSAFLHNPSAVALDADGNIYIADTTNYRVRKVEAETGIIETVAGNGCESCELGNGGPATEATLRRPLGVDLDAAGNLYIADMPSNCIRKVNATTGIITILSGRGPYEAVFDAPREIAFDSAGNLYIAERGQVRRIHGDNGRIDTIAGGVCLSSQEDCRSGGGGPAAAALLGRPGGMVYHDGHLYYADGKNIQIRKLNLQTGEVTIVAGSGCDNWISPDCELGDGGRALDAAMSVPEDIAVDSSGNVYIADMDNQRIQRVDAATELISTVAGSGCGGQDCPLGDGGAATDAAVEWPTTIAVDTSGNLYIGGYSYLIRKVAADSGVIQTVAGNGCYFWNNECELGDGPATEASLFAERIALGPEGDYLYILDSGHNRIRKLDLSSRTITTVSAHLCDPEQESSNCYSNGEGAAAPTGFGRGGFAFDAQGTLYFADMSNGQIRRVDQDTGGVSIVAGSGCSPIVHRCETGDGGPAIEATLDWPRSLAFDEEGNLYIATETRIRVIRAPIN